MADISQINLPNDSTTYDIADLIARGRIWQGTQAQYNALTTIDPDTVYFITDATGTVLATVATTGSYNDLLNKPTIDTSLNTASSNAIANGPVASFAESISQTVSSKASKSDLASIHITGNTNDTGSAISAGTFFYLNGLLVRAKTNIANGATLTANTNYESVTAGGLNKTCTKRTSISGTTNSNGVLESNISVSDYHVFDAYIDVGNQYVDRFVIIGVIDGKYAFRCSNSTITGAVSNTNVTIFYSYIPT